MKKPKLIYTYYFYDRQESGVRKHHLQVRRPSDYNHDPKYFFSFGKTAFTIEAQSNLPGTADHNTNGLRDAYAIRVHDLMIGHPEDFILANKICGGATGHFPFKAIVKRLHKLGGVRYERGQVHDPGYAVDRYEYLPRRFAGKKSKAYWDAITNGIEVVL